MSFFSLFGLWRSIIGVISSKLGAQNQGQHNSMRYSYRNVILYGDGTGTLVSIIDSEATSNIQHKLIGWLKCGVISMTTMSSSSFNNVFTY